MNCKPSTLWSSADHALEYLARADKIPHRTEGERALLEWLPDRVDRFLDLGSGDGRLAAPVKAARPGASLVALDFSPVMLQRLRERFARDEAATILEQHVRFLSELGIGPEDEEVSNQLLDVETQLTWMREIGLEDVDCSWKWMELALLIGTNPNPERRTWNSNFEPNLTTNREP